MLNLDSPSHHMMLRIRSDRPFPIASPYLKVLQRALPMMLCYKLSPRCRLDGRALHLEETWSVTHWPWVGQAGTRLSCHHGSPRKPELTYTFPSSSRLTYDSGHTTPAPYPNAQYQLLTKATEVNASHWKYTAKCTGCTTWTGSAGTTTLNPSQEHRFAFAYSNTKPSGTSPDTAIQVHTVTNYWTHDFNGARNANFEELVQRNL